MPTTSCVASRGRQPASAHAHKRRRPREPLRPAATSSRRRDPPKPPHASHATKQTVLHGETLSFATRAGARGRARVGHPRVGASWRAGPAGPGACAKPKDFNDRLYRGTWPERCSGEVGRECARPRDRAARAAHHEPIETRSGRRDGRLRGDLRGATPGFGVRRLLPPADADRHRHHRRAHAALGVVDPIDALRPDRVLGIAVELRVGAAHPRHGDRRPERRRPLRFDRRADGDADQPPASELPVAELRLRTPAAGASSAGRAAAAGAAPRPP